MGPRGLSGFQRYLGGVAALACSMWLSGCGSSIQASEQQEVREEFSESNYERTMLRLGKTQELSKEQAAAAQRRAEEGAAGITPPAASPHKSEGES